MGSLTAIAVDLVILALVIARQVRVRPLGSPRLPLLIGAAGLIVLLGYTRQHHTGLALIAFIAGSLVVAGLLGAARAVTVRLWRDGGQVLRQGTWLTAALWLVSAGLHLAGGFLPGVPAGTSSASVLLYLGATWGAQHLVLSARARRLSGQPLLSEPAG